MHFDFSSTSSPCHVILDVTLFSVFRAFKVGAGYERVNPVVSSLFPACSRDTTTSAHFFLGVLTRATNARDQNESGTVHIVVLFSTATANFMFCNCLGELQYACEDHASRLFSF